MASSSLPLIDPNRTEFGFERTHCDCADCIRNCRHIPGYLIPADLERIEHEVAPDQDLMVWAQQHLLASPGALVLQRGAAFRIPTLVPARQISGACIFLNSEQRCAIHAVAPFGCAFFDSHQPGAEADRRSGRGLHEILEAWQRNDLYARVWLALHEAGLEAPAPEVCRMELHPPSTGQKQSDFGSKQTKA